MNTCLAVFTILMAMAVSSVSLAQPPDHFELQQNLPDPFCPTIDGGSADVRFQLPVQSVVLLEVWAPDTTVVVRTLVYGVMAAGYHSVIWDGADEGGADLTSGAYPYSMTATAPVSGDSLFYDMLTATIDCPVDTRPGTWGWIKAGFRGE
jgi:hypothetical protein